MSRKEKAKYHGPIPGSQAIEIEVQWLDNKTLMMYVPSTNEEAKIEFVYEQFAKEENFSVPIKRQSKKGYEFL